MADPTTETQTDTILDAIRQNAAAQEGASLVPTVLAHAAKESAEARGFFERMLDKIMLKGSPQPTLANPDPDHDGDNDLLPELDTDRDAGRGRGEGHGLKGVMCKGAGCGKSFMMQKGHPHFGKKRQLAAEHASRFTCPHCGNDEGNEAIMGKGDDELDAPESDMGKGVADATELFLELRDGLRSLATLHDMLRGIADAHADSVETVKGMRDTLDDFTVEIDAMKGQQEEQTAELARGVATTDAFNGAVLEAFDGFAKEQEALKGQLVETGEALKGLFMEQSDAIKGIRPPSPASTRTDPSLFAASLANSRSGRLPERDMSKGEDSAHEGNALTPVELQRGVDRGVIQVGDDTMYRRSGRLGMSGMSVQEFRKAIAPA